MSRSEQSTLLGADLTGFPDVHALDVRLQVLWVLCAMKQRTSIKSLSASEISDILRDDCSIALSRQRISRLLLDERDTVFCTGGRGAKFTIMKKGEDEVLGSASQPLFVDPSRALSIIRAIEGRFSEFNGDVRFCDTYIDSRTIDFLAACTGASRIKLLTENVQDSGRVRRDLTAYMREYPSRPLEIRCATAGQLHDRYAIDPKGMLWFGASLKDIGKKQSMIIELPSSFGEIVAQAFDRIWNNATRF